MGKLNIVNGINKLNKGVQVVETVRDFEKNSKTAVGTVKNAWNVSAIVPADPLTKILIFILMIVIPFAIFTMIIIGFVVILMGIAVIIITKDPSIKYDGSDKSNSAANSDSAADLSVPDDVKGKFLIPWGMSNVISCYHCRKDGYGYHRGMDLQYMDKDWSKGYNAMVYPIYPGEVIRAGDVGHWSWGHAVIVKHKLDSGKTYYTLYAHMMYLKVKVGDKVGFNTPLGKIGNTGATSKKPGQGWCKTGCGVHLHLELLNGAGFEKTGTSSQNLLPLYKYLTCSDSGATLINANGSASASKCVEYRKKKLGNYPWK